MRGANKHQKNQKIKLKNQRKANEITPNQNNVFWRAPFALNFEMMKAEYLVLKLWCVVKSNSFNSYDLFILNGNNEFSESCIFLWAAHHRIKHWRFLTAYELIFHCRVTNTLQWNYLEERTTDERLNHFEVICPWWKHTSIRTTRITNHLFSSSNEV